MMTYRRLSSYDRYRGYKPYVPETDTEVKTGNQSTGMKINDSHQNRIIGKVTDEELARLSDDEYLAALLGVPMENEPLAEEPANLKQEELSTSEPKLDATTQLPIRQPEEERENVSAISITTKPKAAKPKTVKAKTTPDKAENSKSEAVTQPTHKYGEKVSKVILDSELPIDVVAGIIFGSSEGVNIAELKYRTGFDTNKISPLLQKLKKEGRIASPSRGFYVYL